MGDEVEVLADLLPDAGGEVDVLQQPRFGKQHRSGGDGCNQQLFALEGGQKVDQLAVKQRREGDHHAGQHHAGIVPGRKFVQRFVGRDQEAVLGADRLPGGGEDLHRRLEPHQRFGQAGDLVQGKVRVDDDGDFFHKEPPWIEEVRKERMR